ncbi:MAG TPA: c-type cytochrome [Candidatus Omnitrophota bacterium]|nr:c-type cytochrome [Candidatus Omnitrophota bacterium]
MKKVGLVLAALLVAPFAANAADAPAAFNQCKACHKVEAGKNGVGPSLFGVFGKKAGMAEGFKYSDAHKASGLTWDEATLSKYLADPKGTVPGNKMAFAGIKKPEDLKAVVEYLKTVK